MTNLDKNFVYSLANENATWEPFIIEGEQRGQVSLIRETVADNNVVVAGLWKHRPEEHPDGMPYGVENLETFYVIEGEAEITTENGNVVHLKAGHSYSFNGGFAGTWKTIKPFMKMFVIN